MKVTIKGDIPSVNKFLNDITKIAISPELYELKESRPQVNYPEWKSGYIGKYRGIGIYIEYEKGE